MKTAALSLSLVLLVIASTGCRTHRPVVASAAPVGLATEEPGIQDALFVHDALLSASREIDMGRLGIERAENLDLKLLAQEIYDDHVRAHRELRIIAQRENIAVPVAAIDSQWHVGDASGPEFDRLFIQHLLDARRDDIKIFQAAARGAQNTEIREFAGRTLPALQEHLRLAQNISKVAGIVLEIDEPAGAQAPPVEHNPFYEGDPRLRHQFNE